MKLRTTRKSITLILFSATLLLLIANLLINIINQSTEPELNETNLSSPEIDSIFLHSLYSFGLLDDWIKKTKNSKVISEYKVKVPSDLSIPIILAEINKNFWEDNVTISSVEKDFSGRTILNISKTNIIQLRSEFRYDKGIHRTAGTAAFIIEDFELSNEEDSMLLQIPEPFSPLLLPSNENSKIKELIINNDKIYLVLLSDDISELKYKLNEGYTRRRLRNSLLAVINSFPEASFFVIDDKSDLFLSTAYSYLKTELTKRKIKLVKLSSLQRLEYGDVNQLNNTFENFLKSAGVEESITFIITAEGFKTLLPEIERFRKIGYKFVHPSETILEDKVTAKN
ncbi:MAG: hypothetical protein BMS9Abin39_0630 [Ignavibacteria bacterium]|nr:MAG: hypothetical protein BMS9Abin39_0630 [Ignavibacteria bacterium]